MGKTKAVDIEKQYSEIDAARKKDQFDNGDILTYTERFIDLYPFL